MPEVRADHLRPGDQVRVGGQVYDVQRAKAKGKRVHLTLTGRRGTHEGDVKAKAVYDRVSGLSQRSRPQESAAKPSTRQRAVAAPALKSSPLTGPDGAQQRWATPADLVDPPEAEQSIPWTTAERQDLQEFGTRLIAVEVEGGKLVVPPVMDATVLGHLLTMHGVRFDGATFEEAKAHAKAHPEDTSTADEVLDALTMKRAYALHDELHAAKDLLSWPSPHWHRDEAPA